MVSEDRHTAFKYMRDNSKMVNLLAGEEPFIMMEAIALDNTFLMPTNLLKNMI